MTKIFLCLNKKGEKEKDEFGDEIEFTMDLKVQWTNGPSWECELSEGWFRERDLQGLNQSLVLQYWEDKGGRDACCGFDTEQTHFLAIHDEKVDAKSHRKLYQVQFVGYCNDPTFWVEAGRVYPFYPDLVKTWRARQRRDLQMNQTS
ncbi:hypothetical protein Neosp_009944 [[Neocosmospora] mangrovei]